MKAASGETLIMQERECCEGKMHVWKEGIQTKCTGFTMKRNGTTEGVVSGG